MPPPGYSAERDNEEMENIESAAFTVWEERRKGRTAAASTPVWMDAFEYWLIDGPDIEDTGLLAKQPTAVSLTLPIVLKGGGDMQVTFETKKVRRYETSVRRPHTWMEHKLRLIVRTEHGVFSGHWKASAASGTGTSSRCRRTRRRRLPTGSRTPSMRSRN